MLAAIAAAHDATPRQVALALLLRHPSLFTIPKAATTAHLEKNAAAADVVLTADEVLRIDAAFASGRRRRRVPAV